MPLAQIRMLKLFLDRPFPRALAVEQTAPRQGLVAARSRPPGSAQCREYGTGRQDRMRKARPVDRMCCVDRVGTDCRCGIDDQCHVVAEFGGMACGRLDTGICRHTGKNEPFDPALLS